MIRITASAIFIKDFENNNYFHARTFSLWNLRGVLVTFDAIIEIAERSQRIAMVKWEVEDMTKGIR